MFDNIKNWYRGLPDKKKYLELLSALLTIPVLITVIMVNLNNLAQKNSQKETQAPTPAVIRIVETLQPINMMQSVPSTSSSPSATPFISLTPTPAPSVMPSVTPAVTAIPTPTTPAPSLSPTSSATGSAATP